MFDNYNSKNPWLINKNIGESIIGPEKIPLTAEYIWSKQGQDRIDLVDWVFNYYRNKWTQPIYKFDDAIIKNDFKKLIKKNSTEIINDKGELKNSGQLGLNTIKHFTSYLFLQAKGHKKTASCFDVFHDDEKFRKVLQNRMGWNKTKEDGVERPYVFNITDKMIIQGMRSSGLAYSVSHFKPVVAKYFYEKYNVKKTFDPSAGWGARALGAMSCDVEYYATDPLTADDINKMISYFDGKGKVFKSGSEFIDVYKNIPNVDFVFSSTPYFVLEHYSDDELQSDNSYTDYDAWIDKFWKETVKNSLTILEDSGHFGFCMVDQVDKHDIAKDMLQVCYNLGLTLVETVPWKTSASHLSGKKQTKRVSKTTEKTYILRRK